MSIPLVTDGLSMIPAMPIVICSFKSYPAHVHIEYICTAANVSHLQRLTMPP